MNNGSMTRVGFIGLGAMGAGMARACLRAGLTVAGYDVSADAVNAFAHAGGIAASSPADAASGASAIVIMVVNSEQAEEVLFGEAGAAESLSQDGLVVLCSTVAPTFVRKMNTRLLERGLLLLDAPVSGGTVRAAEGTLSVMASGAPAAFAKAAPLLDAMAGQVYRMGDEPGQGATMKLVNQVLAGIHIAAAAEAVAFGARAGIDPNRIYEVVGSSAGASWMFQDRLPHILADDFAPRSAVGIWLKDLSLILDTGRDLKIPTPLAAVALQLFTMAAASGYTRLDDSAVVKVFEKLADFRVLDAAPSATSPSES